MTNSCILSGDHYSRWWKGWRWVVGPIADSQLLMYSLGIMPITHTNRSIFAGGALLLFAVALSACAMSTQAPAASEPEARSLPSEEPAPTVEPTRTPDELIVDAIDAGNAGNWTLAVSRLDQALEANAANAQALLLRANAQRALGNLELAAADYALAINIDANMAVAYYGRALLYQEQGGSENALADFSQAIALEPGYVLAYKGRAALQQAAANYAAARLDLEVYLTLVPNAPDRSSVEAQIAELLSLAEASAGEGALLYADDFADAGSGWYSNGSESAQMEYLDGAYRITINAASSGALAYSGQTFANARIEALAQKQIGPEDSNWFGLLCRMQTTEGVPSFYAFIISSDGYYGIGKRVGGSSLQLLNAAEMQFSNAIIQGNSANLLAADCTGERLILYVNGVKLVEVSDADLDVGQVGLIVGTFAEPGAVVSFDDFAVYSANP